MLCLKVTVVIKHCVLMCIQREALYIETYPSWIVNTKQESMLYSLHV